MYTNNTKIFGILGFPLGHTLSPWIHNTLFELSKYNGVYLVFERSDWPIIGLDSLKTIGVKGLSVTIPYKEFAFRVANEACLASQTMKAANTLLISENHIQAKNTDGEGALRSILEKDTKLLSAKDSSSVLILGSGGSAKGIVYALNQYLESQNTNKINKNIRIFARNESAVQEIINSVGGNHLVSSISKEELYSIRKNFSLIVHTSPLGMKGIEGEPMLSGDFFNKHQSLFDIVYNPLETELVKLAKKKKTQIIPGYSMLLYQGIRQFEYFTDMEVKQKWISKIEKILYQKLKSK
ncbi:MAG: shikimate dehydrogenase [Leptospira sp.]|nr:shikimate dehydrogenase [Leptospira sp.]